MYNQAHCFGGAGESPAFYHLPRMKRAMSLNKTQKPVPASQPEPGFEAMLVQVGAKKDKEAFAALFGYFAPRVKSYMLKNGLGEAAAEEIVQNTFVTVWEKAASYDPKKAAASTWIFTIARNKRIDALRKDKNLEVNSDSPDITNAFYDAEEAYADQQDVDKLNDAIGALPPEQARLVRMAFFDDKSHSDISKETKLPLGTVKSRLRLALDKLRGALSSGGRA